MPSLPLMGLIHDARPVFDMDRVNPIQNIVGSAKGNTMMLFLADGGVSFWDMSQGRETMRVAGDDSGVPNAAASADDAPVAVSASSNGTISLWSLKKLAGMTSIHVGGDVNIDAVAISRDGVLVAGGFHDGNVRVWDANGSEKPHMMGGQFPVTTLAFSPDKATLTTADAGGEARVWNVSTGALVKSKKISSSPIQSLELMAGGGKALVSDSNGVVRVWDMNDQVQDLPTGAGPVSAMTLSHDGRTAAVGKKDGAVQLIDVASGRVKLNIAGNFPIRSVGFGKGGSLLFVLLEDGTIRVVSPTSGADVVRLVVASEGWVAISPKGQFDGEGNGIDAAKWMAANGNASFALEQFTESSFEPGLMPRMAENQPPPAAIVVSKEFAVPPAVTIDGLRDGATIDLDTVTINVATNDLGGGVGEVRVFLNGKLVSQNKSPAGAKSLAVPVHLIEGSNTISAVALSRDNIEGQKTSIHVTRPGHARLGTMRAMTVGINQYAHKELSLEYGVPDSDGIEAYFKTVPTSIFTKVAPSSLRNAQATKRGILSAFASLEDSNPEDTVLIYMAGHGEAVDSKWYFIPQDIAYPLKRSDIPTGGLSMAEVSAAIAKTKAQKVVLLLDACKSGAALTDVRNFEARKEWTNLARLNGVHVIAAAGKDQYAAEVPDLGHGVFTYILLKGLQGGAAQGGKVMVAELGNYVKEKLPALVAKYSDEMQVPVIYSRGGDFALGGR